MGIKKLASKIALISFLGFAAINTNGCYTVLEHREITRNNAIEERIEINNYEENYSAGGGYFYSPLLFDSYGPFWRDYGYRYYRPDFGFGYNDFWLGYDYSPYRYYPSRHYSHIPLFFDLLRNRDREHNKDNNIKPANNQPKESQIRKDRLEPIIRRNPQNINQPTQQNRTQPNQNQANQSQRNYQNQQKDKTVYQQPQQSQQPKQNPPKIEKSSNQQPQNNPSPQIRTNFDNIFQMQRREPLNFQQPQVKISKPSVQTPQTQRSSPTQQRDNSAKEKPARRNAK